MKKLKAYICYNGFGIAILYSVRKTRKECRKIIEKETKQSWKFLQQNLDFVITPIEIELPKTIVENTNEFHRLCKENDKLNRK